MDRNKALFKIGKTVIDLYSRLMMDVDVQGTLNMPIGSKLIVANHPSTFDPFYLAAAVNQPTHILITSQVFDIPVAGDILTWGKHVSVNKANGSQAFVEAKRLLEMGKTVIIFPEGSLSPYTGGMCKARSGAARLALLTGVPVIPIGISLLRENLQPFQTYHEGREITAYSYWQGPYSMTIGSPLSFSGNVEDRQLVRGVSQQIMHHIMGLSTVSAQRMHQRLHPVQRNLTLDQLVPFIRKPMPGSAY
jgi:1-acyl-sn-glycerol-3-phosphate acyltransferase